MNITPENRQDWLARYLDEELDEAEKAFLEQALAQDADLRAESARQQEAQKLLLQTLEEESLRRAMQDVFAQEAGFIKETAQEIKKEAAPSQSSNRFMGWWGIVVIFLALIGIVSIGFLWNWGRNTIGSANEKTNQDAAKTISISADTTTKPTPAIDTTDKPSSREAKPTTQDPRLDSIPMFIFRNAYGHSGDGSTKRASRLVLLYATKPQANLDAPAYLLTDTLKLYKVENLRELTLLYYEGNSTYQLKWRTDTLSLQFGEPKWRKLQK
jgi:hypothetical protein